MTAGRLLAVSDLHAGIADNRPIIESLRPSSDQDWLIVAGDVAELSQDIEWALKLLAGRFARVIWTPGNHELWTPRDDAVQLRARTATTIWWPAAASGASRRRRIPTRSGRERAARWPSPRCSPCTTTASGRPG